MEDKMQKDEPSSGEAGEKKTSFSHKSCAVKQCGPCARQGGVFFIGLLVFIFFAAIIFFSQQANHDGKTVLSSAVREGGTPDEERKTGDQQKQQDSPVHTADGAGPDSQSGETAGQTESEDACPGCMTSLRYVLPHRPDVRHLRVPKEVEIRGRWVANMPDAVVEAIFDHISFQIIYDANFEVGIRRYARGYYSYDDTTGVLSLKPAYKMDPPPPVPGIVFQVLTLRYYDVVLRTDAGASLQYWTAPPFNPRQRDIFPLLSFTGVQDDPYLVWQKMD
ncbi:MAG: hypothetical protein KDI90_01895 [Alphaproteobacteria bacterium]|nr:hypothetical protein [Alphaproteobacteria bacterium]MCB9975197.1 hypothetical protein [Rhodospirillales bacterium]